MGTSTVNLSLPSDLLRDIDAEARRQRQSRSEYLRQAARVQVERTRRWNRLMTFMAAHARRRHITQEDIEAAIREVRQGTR